MIEISKNNLQDLTDRYNLDLNINSIDYIETNNHKYRIVDDEHNKHILSDIDIFTLEVYYAN